MLKYFTEKDYGNGGRTLAINPRNVAAVIEEKEFTTIVLVSGRSFEIQNSYLDTVARLHEM